MNRDTNKIVIGLELTLEAYQILMEESELIRDEEGLTTLKELLENDMNKEPETFAELLGWDNY